MKPIIRHGTSSRWADVVVYQAVARWVEVAEDQTLDARGQIAQVLAQIDATLGQVGSDRTRLLEITIFLAELNNLPLLNAIWDDWVPAGHPPVRACVGAQLAAGCQVEMLIAAACEPPTASAGY